MLYAIGGDSDTPVSPVVERASVGGHAQALEILHTGEGFRKRLLCRRWGVQPLKLTTASAMRLFAYSEGMTLNSRSTFKVADPKSSQLRSQEQSQYLIIPPDLHSGRWAHAG